MRGDSLRDLYAKTLALFGLALLAGVGALVDYWPAPVALPAVASPAVRPVPAALPAVASLDAAILTAASLTSRGRTATLRAVTRREPALVANHSLPANGAVAPWLPRRHEHVPRHSAQRARLGST